MSVKHLHRYMSEFQFRFNSRQDEEIFACVVISLVINKRSATRSLRVLRRRPPAVPEPSDIEPF